MTYTKKDFGSDLKRKILGKKSLQEIARWSYINYLDWHDIEDKTFHKLLLDLNAMEDGPEFAYTYEELNKIADDLIAGKEVKL